VEEQNTSKLLQRAKLRVTEQDPNGTYFWQLTNTA
jgi:hypothetical protein